MYEYSCNVHFVHAFSTVLVHDQMLIEDNCGPPRNLETVEILSLLVMVQQLKQILKDYYRLFGTKATTKNK